MIHVLADSAIKPGEMVINAVFLLAVGAVVLGFYQWFGVFSPKAFDKAPPRDGRMGLFDLFSGFVLLVLGMMTAGMVLGRLGDAKGPMTAGRMLREMMASQGAMLPAIAFVCIRASQSVQGGLGAFGFSLRRIGPALRMALLAVLTVIPLTMVVSGLLVLGLKLAGQNPELLAHETLRVLVDEPSGLTRWLTILSAVVFAPVCEEIIFRGLVQTSLLQSGLVRGRWTVIVMASVLFTFVHLWVADWYALPALFVLALGLGYAYERTGSLYANMLLHGIFNTIQIVIALNAQTLQHAAT